MKKLLLLTMLILALTSLVAQGTPGLQFTLIDGDTAYEVSGGTAEATHIEIPATHEGLLVTRIAEWGFWAFDTMTSITIPNSVKSIGNYAFAYCTDLTSINIPDSVTSIDSNPFLSCYNLETITVSAGNTIFKSEGNCLIRISDNTLIAGTKNSIIPNSVESIGDEAFFGCVGLTSIDIPDSVTSIGAYAFSECFGLTSVTIGRGVTSIGTNAFAGCNELIYIVIPKEVIRIETHAFIFCEELTIYAEIESKPDGWEDGWNSKDGIFTLPVLWNTVLTQSGTLGLALTLIDGGTAYEVSKGMATATHVEIPDSYNNIPITQIVEWGFLQYSEMTSITIGNNVTLIETSAFAECTGLTYMNIPNNVTVIGGWVFDWCTNLTSVFIPNSVVTIGGNIGDNIDNLTIYVEAASQPSGWAVDWNNAGYNVVWGFVFNAPAPLNLSAVYEYVSINLSWGEPVDSSSGTFSHYRVYRNGIRIADEVSGLNFIDTEFETWVEYEYYVTAVYSAPFMESEPSNIAKVKYDNVLPVMLSEFRAVSIENGVRIYWTAETEASMTGYRVKRAEMENVTIGVYISALIDARNNPTTERYYHIDREVVNGREYFYWLETIENDGTKEVFGPVSVVYTSDGDDVPITMTTMSSAYPNPMNLGTIANFEIAVKDNETAELRIYNIRGQVVRSYENIPAGHQTVIWDGRDVNGREVSSGVYFYRLTSPSSHIVQRMVVVK